MSTVCGGKVGGRFACGGGPVSLTARRGPPCGTLLGTATIADETSMVWLLTDPAGTLVPVLPTLRITAPSSASASVSFSGFVANPSETDTVAINLYLAFYNAALPGAVQYSSVPVRVTLAPLQIISLELSQALPLAPGTYVWYLVGSNTEEAAAEVIVRGSLVAEWRSAVC
jgi:hypothetical protein